MSYLCSLKRIDVKFEETLREVREQDTKEEYVLNDSVNLENERDLLGNEEEQAYYGNCNTESDQSDNDESDVLYELTLLEAWHFIARSLTQ